MRGHKLGSGIGTASYLLYIFWNLTMYLCCPFVTVFTGALGIKTQSCLRSVTVGFRECFSLMTDSRSATTSSPSWTWSRDWSRKKLCSHALSKDRWLFTHFFFISSTNHRPTLKAFYFEAPELDVDIHTCWRLTIHKKVADLIVVDFYYWNCPQEKNSSAVISHPDQGA